MEFQDPIFGVLACAAAVQLVDLITGKIQMHDRQSGVIMSPRTPEAGDHGGTTGQTEMEWEEALLRARGGEIPPQPGTYYRRKAARARQVAEGVTTQAIKALLLDEAVHCDQLAADADRGAGEAAGLESVALSPSPRPLTETIEGLANRAAQPS